MTSKKHGLDSTSLVLIQESKDKKTSKRILRFAPFVKHDLDDGQRFCQQGPNLVNVQYIKSEEHLLVKGIPHQLS